MLRRGVHLETLTLGWVSIGAVTLLIAAATADSPALTGFGLLLLIEAVASSAAIAALRGKDWNHPGRVRRPVGYGYLALVMVVLTQSTWVLTGTLSRWSRSAAETRIKSLGGRIADSVTKKTTHVLVGEAPGSKLARAQQLGIPILDEEAFEKEAGAPS